ncbi:hypothetical protein HAX54_016094, partial [Datura stramonium]|nr:hypothetical protein [Datura stramonium]
DIEEKALKFHSLRQVLGWGTLVEDPGKAIEGWVREFYSNLPTKLGVGMSQWPMSGADKSSRPFQKSKLKDQDVPRNKQWLVDFGGG